MKPKILLVNPPIYDFTAYDFWLKPYGLLRAGGMLRPVADLHLFDYLDRLNPASGQLKTDRWGCGRFPEERIEKPEALKDVPRYFRRYGIKRSVFQDFLSKQADFDCVLIGTVMTYWYLGYKEVIEDIRRICPAAKIVLGGFYATACGDHARSLGADAVVIGDDFSPLWRLLNSEPIESFQLPAWQLYPKLRNAVLNLSQGCPFQCSYCYVPQSGTPFQIRPINECLSELQMLVHLGAENIAFYDDALLFGAEKTLLPFLRTVVEKGIQISFHSPNALHARFVTAELAEWMVKAGMKTFYLGFESHSEAFHNQSGPAKVISQELADAVKYLKDAGADPNLICAYEMLGHPRGDMQHLEESMRFASSLGIQIMLSDFSPIPGTPDGELCSNIVDLAEPLNHNKTAFPIRFLGLDKVQYYKDLCKTLNQQIRGKL